MSQQKLTQEFVELLQQEIERVMEIHQVEIDRRFDRLHTRLSDLERNAVDKPQLALELVNMDRKIAEAELAIRKYFGTLLDPVQGALDGQNELLRQLQGIIDSQTVGNFWQAGESQQ